MEERFDKALADKFKSLVGENEFEPYEIGAWENFEVKAFGRQGNPFRFVWIGLAASFLMAMSMDTLYNSSKLDIINFNKSLSFTTDESSFDVNRVSLAKNGLQTEVSNSEKFELKNERFENINSQSSYSSSNLLPSTYDVLEPKEMFAVTSIGNQVSLSPATFNNRSNSSFSIQRRNEEPFKTDKNRLFKVGVLIASSLNAVSSKVSGHSLGAGVIAEVPFSRNISLNSGLVLNSQKFSFKTKGDIPNASTTQSKMLSIDVPLNVKYNFSKKNKNELFVSAGVSSVAYLKESYSDNFSSSMELQDSDIKFEKASSGFDIAKFINLSLGLEIPFEKQLSILIEPYLKYPIGRSTSRDLELTSAGLSLRLNMGLAKLY